MHGVVTDSHREGSIRETDGSAGGFVSKWIPIFFTHCWYQYHHYVPQVPYLPTTTINHLLYNIYYEIFTLPVAHMAITKYWRYGCGFNIFTAIHPSVPPNRNVIPMFTGMNHLYFFSSTPHLNFIYYNFLNSLLTTFFTKIQHY